MSTRIGWRSAAAALVFYAPPAFAMRCGTELVREGQTKFDVLQRCGQPAYTESRIVYRSVAGYGYAPYPQRPYAQYPAPVILPIEVDEWIYNFGPTQLMPSLIFEDGRLVKERLLGYGR